MGIFKFKGIKISRLFFVYITLTVTLLVVVLAVVYSITEINRFETKAQISKENYINNQKNTVKIVVEKIIEHIHFTQESLEDEMKLYITERVDEAHRIATNIYLKNRNSLSEKQLKKVVIESLRPVRFYNGRGYIFIVSMEGQELLYPVMPEFEGFNVLNLQDKKGHFVIKNEIKVIKEHSKGFVTDYWTKPGEDTSKVYPKTSYVKYFEPFEWYIGAGEYLDNVVKDIQNEAKEYIRDTHFGTDGYAFVNTLDGKVIVFNTPEYKEGDDLWDFKDSIGNKVMQNDAEMAKNPEGGFTYYTWKKPSTGLETRKVAFIKAVSEWNWMIGAGIYLDEIDKTIELERGEMIRLLRISLLIRFAILLAVLFIILYISGRVSKMIRSNFERFQKKINIAVNKNKIIEVDDYNLTELQIASKTINEIVQKKKVAEDKLKESESRFRTIFENVPVMFAVIATDNKIILWNRLMDKVFGISDLDTLDIQSLADKQNKKAEAFFALLELEEGQFREITFDTPFGQQIHHWTFFRTSSGELIIVGYDFTKEKEYQTQLKDLNLTKDKLFSIIAHDLKNPFNSILGFTEILKVRYSTFTDEKRIAIINDLSKSSKSAFVLLENLLNWARMQQGGISISKEITSVLKTVRESIEPYMPNAIKKNIVVDFNVDETATWLVDFNTTKIALGNIINNAIKFTHNNGRIALSYSVNNGFNTITITDNGVGMTEEQIDKLFVLSSVNSTTGTDNEKGTGLGLILCKDFIELNGGNVTVESEVGVGSTFYVNIPV